MRTIARRLHADLQANDVPCWFAPHDMRIGDRLIDRIDQAISSHKKLLLILSESSVDSAWVEAEVKTALMRERSENRAVLFPIRIDDTVLQPTEGWAGSSASGISTISAPGKTMMLIGWRSSVCWATCAPGEDRARSGLHPRRADA